MTEAEAIAIINQLAGVFSGSGEAIPAIADVEEAIRVLATAAEQEAPAVLSEQETPSGEKTLDAASVKRIKDLAEWLVERAKALRAAAEAYEKLRESLPEGDLVEAVKKKARL